MQIIRCGYCDKRIGAVYEDGRHEWEGGVQTDGEDYYCRDCFNNHIMADVETMGGIDGVDIE